MNGLLASRIPLMSSVSLEHQTEVPETAGRLPWEWGPGVIPGATLLSDGVSSSPLPLQQASQPWLGFPPPEAHLLGPDPSPSVQHVRALSNCLKTLSFR